MRKQSFLERLTGTQTISDEDISLEQEGRSSEGLAKEKPWSQRVDEEEEQELPQYAPEVREEEPVAEEEDESDEPGLAIDMYESDNELVLQSMIAGVTPENLHISITRDTVTIRGKRNAPVGIPEEHFITRELYWGTFSRVIELPYEINTDGAEAVEKYGLLIIRLPKIDTAKTAELKVKSI